LTNRMKLVMKILKLLENVSIVHRCNTNILVVVLNPTWLLMKHIKKKILTFFYTVTGVVKTKKNFYSSRSYNVNSPYRYAFPSFPPPAGRIWWQGFRSQSSLLPLLVLPLIFTIQNSRNIIWWWTWRWVIFLLLYNQIRNIIRYAYASGMIDLLKIYPGSCRLATSLGLP